MPFLKVFDILVVLNKGGIEMETNSMGFEIEVCGRCGGVGRYSYNLIHGDRCYGCGGAGKRLTKRGAAAHEFYINQQIRPMSEIRVGDWLWDTIYGKAAKFCKVLTIEVSGSYTYGPDGEHIHYTNISTERSALGVLPTSTVRFVRDEAERTAFRDAALVFQDTLTKTGKPKKTK